MSETSSIGDRAMKSNTNCGASTVNRNRQEQYCLFDKLPEIVRRAMAHAPFNFDTVPPAELYKKGATAEEILSILQSVIRRRLDNPFTGTAATYGACHPQAQRDAP